MGYPLNPKLDHPAYHGLVRLPKYNTVTTVFQACTANDAGKVLRRLNPRWTPEDHQTLAERHAAEARKLKARHAELLEEAARETFGRPFQMVDYRISAIGSDEFSEDKKRELRHAAHAATGHSLVSQAHRQASRWRNPFR